MTEATGMVRTSRYPFAETVTRLSAAIEAAGSRIFATIDQAEAANRVGLTLRPTTLLVFGNPKGGTPLMDAFPEFGLELPLKMLVWQEGGDVFVAAPRMPALAARYGVTGHDAALAAMDRAVAALMDDVATP